MVVVICPVKKRCSRKNTFYGLKHTARHCHDLLMTTLKASGLKRYSIIPRLLLVDSKSKKMKLIVGFDMNGLVVAGPD